jgi:hypothetical protein
MTTTHGRDIALVVAAAALVLSACNGGTAPLNIQSSLPSAAPPSTSATASAAAGSASGTASSAGGQPRPGGVELLRAYQDLLAARAPLLNDIGTAGKTLDWQRAVGDVRKIRDAEYQFNLAARKASVDSTTAPDFNAMLAADNNLISVLDRASSASDSDSFKAADQQVNDAGQKADDAELKVLSDLDAATKNPTKHMAPTTLPAAVQGTENNGKPFPTESGNQAAADYVSGGYRLSVSGTTGSVQEQVTRKLSLGDTSVTVDVALTGPDTTGFATCRGTGSGTDAGEIYAAGVSSNGAFYIQDLDTANHQVRTLASGQAADAPTGTDVKDVIRMDCIGHYLTLVVNQKPVFQVFDSKLSTGNVGVASSVNSGPGSVTVSAFSAFGSEH